MKKTKIILAAILFGAFTVGIPGCKKDDLSMAPADPADNSGSSTSRMWVTGQQLYAVGHNASAQAFLYTVTPPGFGGLAPTLVTGFFDGATQITVVTGIACTPTDMIICTHSTSNYPNSLLIYPAGGPYTSPTIVSTSALSDIEYNEYDGVLYGIESGTDIVSINTGSGATTVDLAVAPGAGLTVKGLCNYNALLSFSVSDNTGAADNFYSYSPGGSPGAPLFSTDFGVGQGGMQYCDGIGWAIISSVDTKKVVDATYTVFGPTAMAGAPYRISDLTSD